jgi:hypothetical protein
LTSKLLRMRSITQGSFLRNGEYALSLKGCIRIIALCSERPDSDFPETVSAHNKLICVAPLG